MHHFHFISFTFYIYNLRSISLPTDLPLPAAPQHQPGRPLQPLPCLRLRPPQLRSRSIWFGLLCMAWFGLIDTAIKTADGATFSDSQVQPALGWIAPSSHAFLPTLTLSRLLHRLVRLRAIQSSEPVIMTQIFFQYTSNVRYSRVKMALTLTHQPDICLFPPFIPTNPITPLNNDLLDFEQI